MFLFPFVSKSGEKILTLEISVPLPTVTHDHWAQNQKIVFSYQLKSLGLINKQRLTVNDKLEKS